MELPFVFDGTEAHFSQAPNDAVDASASRRALAGRMHAAWVAFAQSGDPGWPTYGPLQIIDVAWRLSTYRRPQAFASWTGETTD